MKKMLILGAGIGIGLGIGYAINKGLEQEQLMFDAKHLAQEIADMRVQYDRELDLFQKGANGDLESYYKVSMYCNAQELLNKLEAKVAKITINKDILKKDLEVARDVVNYLKEESKESGY